MGVGGWTDIPSAHNHAAGQGSQLRTHPHPVQKVSSPSQGLLTSLELAPLILLPLRNIYHLNFQPTNSNQGPYRSATGNKKKKKVCLSFGVKSCLSQMTLPLGCFLVLCVLIPSQGQLT